MNKAASTVVTLGALLLLPVSTLGGTPSVDACAALTGIPQFDWKETFAADAVVRSQGGYAGKQAWTFESFSAKTLKASTTMTLSVKNRRVQLNDSVPALISKPPQGAFDMADGAMTMTGWVKSKFSDVVVSGTFNTDSPRTGSVSRQGLIARWDLKKTCYWFHIDFAQGTYSITKSGPEGTEHAGEHVKGSEGKIADFKNTASYSLEFILIGDTLQGKVYDSAKRLVGQTPVLKDATPITCGVAGIDVEVAQASPLIPLQGSLANISALAPESARK
jgi:hypothetical protein